MKTDFRTKIPALQSHIKFSHQDKFLLIGSCFSQNIGQKQIEYKFPTLINPFGITYNPISLHESLDNEFRVKVEENKGVFYAHQLHSSFNQLSAAQLTKKFDQQKAMLQHFLNASTTIIITYGTAWVYKKNGSNEIVNNCHKIPANNFTKKLLTVEEIVQSYENLKSRLTPQFKNVLFTISPVRHLKDGFHENQLSKSTLLLAVEQICKINDNCSYFPAYEIMMDDLRDYRFYGSDFLHPTDLAIEYIWNIFSTTYFNPDTLAIMEQIKKFNAAMHHRPFLTNSHAHQQFLTSLVEKLTAFQHQHHIDFTREIQLLKNQL